MQSKYHDIYLEIQILSRCVDANYNIADLAQLVNRDDFYLEKNKEVYDYLIAKYNLNEAIDETVLFRELDLSKQWKDEFYNALAGVEIKQLLKLLKDLSIKRRLDSLCKLAIHELNFNSVKGFDYTNDLHNKLGKLLESKNDDGIKTSRASVLELYSELERVSQLVDKSLIGLDTGLSMLNHYTKGLKAGELVIIAARPGNGKTTLALNIVLTALKRDKNVLFFSLEQEAHNLFAKLISSDTSINLSDILQASLTNNEFECIQHSANFLSSKKLFVYDGGFLNIDELRISARKYHKEHKLDLIVLDYIGLMSSNSKLDRHLQVAEITRNLKMLALELKIPIVALSQLNRAMESRANKKPLLSDLRESGSIEQDADIVLFLSENENAQNTLCERPTILTIAKNRRGECADIYLDFKARISKFCMIDNHTEEYL